MRTWPLLIRNKPVTLLARVFLWFSDLRLLLLLVTLILLQAKPKEHNMRIMVQDEEKFSGSKAGLKDQYEKKALEAILTVSIYIIYHHGILTYFDIHRDIQHHGHESFSINLSSGTTASFVLDIWLFVTFLSDPTQSLRSKLNKKI